jgi:DNA polymerase (family 10)
MTETNRRLTTLFNSMADLLAAQSDKIRAEGFRAGKLGVDRSSDAPGINPHRIKAYRRAAATIASLSEDIGVVAARGELQQLSGIGRELSAKIEEFLRTGTIRAYEELTRPLPSEVRRWCHLPGFSEPLVQQLYHRLGIQTIQDLETLVRSHFLRTLPGVTITEEAVLEALRKDVASV